MRTHCVQSDIVVSKFDLLSCNSVHNQTNTLRKGLHTLGLKTIG